MCFFLGSDCARTVGIKFTLAMAKPWLKLMARLVCYYMNVCKNTNQQVLFSYCICLEF